MARDDEAARRAVAVRERLAADVGREDEVAGVGEREAPAIAGDRHDADVRARRREPRVVEQAADPHAAPALRRREAARAVERRDDLVAAVEGVRGRDSGRPTSPPTANRYARAESGRGASATHDVTGKSLPVNEPAS